MTPMPPEGDRAMRLLLFVLALAVGASARVEAQRLQPAGIVRPHANATHASDVSLIAVRAAASRDDEGHVWLWVGIGAMTGALLGGIWTAVEVSHEDDVFFPELAVAAGAGLGALAGGILGALAYVGSHDNSQR